MGEKRTPAERAAIKKPAKKTAGGRGGKLENYLKLVRSSLGLSLRDVEQGCGVPNATLCQAEYGAEITLSNAMALAWFYGKKIEELWVPVRGPRAK